MALCTETCASEGKTVHVPTGFDGTYWLVPVESLNDITNPSRDNAYILPDESVWVLNHDGDDYIQIASAGTGSQPTLISNEDGYITVTGSGTYSVVVGLDAEKVETLVGTIVDGALTSITESVASNTSDIATLKTDVESLNDSLANNYGGTNLLAGTKNFTGVDDKTYVTTETYRNFAIARVDRSSADAASYINLVSWDKAIQIESDTWYTLNFWAKGTGTLNSYFWSSVETAVKEGINSAGMTTTADNGNILTSVSSEWKRYWVSWKTKPGLTESILRSLIPCRVYGGNDIYMCGVMFERGKFAHDWDYSPKDVATNEDLATLKTSLNALADRVTVLENQ